MVGDHSGRQPQQRVNRLPAHVERGHPGGGAHGNNLAGCPGEVVQDRRLTRTRPARDEHVFAGVLNALVDGELLGAEFDLAHVSPS